MSQRIARCSDRHTHEHRHRRRIGSRRWRAQNGGGETAHQKLTFDGDTALWTMAIKPDKTADFEQIMAEDAGGADEVFGSHCGGSRPPAGK